MSFRPSSSAALAAALYVAAALCLAAGPAEAVVRATPAGPANEIPARTANGYLALDRLPVTFPDPATGLARALTIEVWLVPEDPKNLARAQAAKKAIREAMREDLEAAGWHAFEDPAKGLQAAKRTVAKSVARASGAKLRDVLIKTLVLY